MEPNIEATGAAGVEPVAEERHAYASWGQRVAAVIVDGLLTLMASALAVLVVLALTGGLSQIREAAETQTEADDRIFGLAYFGWLGAWFVVGAVYSTYFHGKSGQTPGKMMLAIRVMDDRAEGPIGYGRAFARWFVTGLFWNLFTIPGVLESLWPLWDAKNQTWHDKIANSIVLRA